MRIRFIDLADSDVPGVPFAPGQVIDVPELTHAMRAALARGLAVAMSDECDEMAVVGVSERAVSRKGKRG